MQNDSFATIKGTSATLTLQKLDAACSPIINRILQAQRANSKQQGLISTYVSAVDAFMKPLRHALANSTSTNAPLHFSCDVTADSDADDHSVTSESAILPHHNLARQGGLPSVNSGTRRSAGVMLPTPLSVLPPRSRDINVNNAAAMLGSASVDSAPLQLHLSPSSNDFLPVADILDALEGVLSAVVTALNEAQQIAFELSNRSRRASNVTFAKQQPTTMLSPTSPLKRADTDHGFGAIVSPSFDDTPKGGATSAPFANFSFREAIAKPRGASLTVYPMSLTPKTTELALGPRHRADSTFSMCHGPEARITADAVVSDVEWDGTSTINQYVLLQPLGQGSQGEVVLAVDSNTNQYRAIKVIARPPGSEGTSPSQGQLSMEEPNLPVVASVKSRLQRSRGRMSQLRREIAAMKRCKHRNIITLYEVIDDPAVHSLYLVMQYVERGSLAKMMKGGRSSQTFPPDQLARYARQICAGLQYLHNHGIVHRDIKPDNILLGSDDVVFLSDFGMSDLFDGSVAAEGAGVSDTRGTTNFFAPELLRAGSPSMGNSGSGVDGKLVDVWALGLTFYVLLYGKLPWSTEGALGTILDRICTTEIEFPRSFTISPSTGSLLSSNATVDDIVINVDEGWITLLSGMLQRDPAQRLPLDRVRALVRELSDEAELRETAIDFPGIDDTEDSPALTPAARPNTRPNGHSPKFYGSPAAAVRFVQPPVKSVVSPPPRQDIVAAGSPSFASLDLNE